MKSSLVLTSLIMAGAVSFPAAGAAQTFGLGVGQRFPELVLPDLEGEPLSVTSFRGRKLALHVWASW